MKFACKAVKGAASCCLGARPGPLAAPVQEVEAGAWRKIKKKRAAAAFIHHLSLAFMRNNYKSADSGLKKQGEAACGAAHRKTIYSLLSVENITQLWIITQIESTGFANYTCLGSGSVASLLPVICDGRRKSCQDELLSCHYYRDMAAGRGGSFLIRKQLFEKLVPHR